MAAPRPEVNAPVAVPNIVITNPVHDEVRARLETVGRVEMNSSTEPWTPAQLTERMRDADAMMGFMTDCVDNALLAQSPPARADFR